ncbi:hypothetical protein BDK92_2607 [Micromonospora pisi]|uniref:Uncharacterized protein n=1 Tax=Micromonospora pisi TaxID=589240 RepID=A0A495JH26_9ACTN|nr:hypothetical protein [Micromonospora pisi]RKR88296.1 hypothetical protein BDK92_2607 [Micromonospora pisi]
MNQHPNPMFVLTDDTYNARGAVVVENGRWIGRDTSGARLFDRRDIHGTEAAAKNLGLRLVTSAWYGVQTGGPTSPDQRTHSAPDAMPHERLFKTHNHQSRPPTHTVHDKRDCPHAKGVNHQHIRTATGREVMTAWLANERQVDRLELCDICLPAAAPTMNTLADFKRAAVPGSRWMCINRIHPQVSGIRTVTGGKTRLRYTGTKADGSTIDNGGMDFPKASECRITGNAVNVLEEAGSDLVAFTWNRLPDGPPTEAVRLPRLITARPWKRELRGTDEKRWCVYDTQRARVAPMAGPDAEDGDGAYFATEEQAQAWINQHSTPVAEPMSTGEHAAPPGSTCDGWDERNPHSDWAYDVDDYGIVYGDGAWPFYIDGQPARVRLSPTTFRAWGSRYAATWPDHPGHAAASFNCDVRPQGMGATGRRVTVDINLLTNTFTVPDSCPLELREEAIAHAQRILDVIIAARADREHYARPWTAHDRHDAKQAAAAGLEAPVRERRPTPLVPPAAASVSTDVYAVRQYETVWQRVGPDEWLFMHPSGATSRPCEHRHDTATVRLLGPVEPIDSRPVKVLDRLTADLVGATVKVQFGRRYVDLWVESAEAGFLYGQTDRVGPRVVHLAETGLPLDLPPLLDQHGHPIAVGDYVQEYTNGRIGPQPAGEYVGTFRVVAVDDLDRVVFTNRYAHDGQEQAVAFPADVRRVPAISVPQWPTSYRPATEPDQPSEPFPADQVLPTNPTPQS